MLAVVASAALHGALLHSLAQLPRGWQRGEWSATHPGSGRLHATLRAAPPGIAAQRPEEPVAEPAAPPVLAPPEVPPARQPAPAAVPVPGRTGDDAQAREPESARSGAASPSVAVLSAPVYYPVSELDQRPLIKVHVEPRFPPGAPAATGRVVLRLFIGEAGQVEDTAVVESEPAGAFEKSALEAFAAARFTPGIKNGVPVRSRMTIEVLFGAPPPMTPQAPNSTTPQPPGS